MSKFDSVLDQALKIKKLTKKHSDKAIIPNLAKQYSEILKTINEIGSLKDNFTIQEYYEYRLYGPSFCNRK